MRLYSAINQDPNCLDLAREVTLRNVLLSYAYTDHKRPERTVEFFAALKGAGTEKTMLDCGAFTAFKQGGHVELTEYERAIDAIQPDVYFQLDVIGDPAETRRHLEQMRVDGYDPVPIFTRGAPWEDLERLKREGNYIALGNISAGRGTVHAMKPWLDNVFRILGPGVKTHAFGVTSGTALSTWPFYSADSTAVLKAASYGLARALDETGRFKNLWVNRKAEDAWRHPDLTDALGQKNWRQRRIKSAQGFAKLERHITKLWAARGVVWDDD